jgi:hypothetical protein
LKSSRLLAKEKGSEMRHMGKTREPYNLMGFSAGARQFDLKALEGLKCHLPLQTCGLRTSEAPRASARGILAKASELLPSIANGYNFMV